MKKRTKILIIIGLLVALSGVAWLMLRDTDHKDPELPYVTKNESPSSEKPASTEWITYKDDEAKITFRYPVNWTHQAGEALYFEDTHELGAVDGKLQSPTGHIMNWNYVVWGGKGGDCDSNSEDQPFKEDNKCSSKQILTVEKLPPLTGPENRLLKDALYITHTKYLSSLDESKITFQVCLDTSPARDPPPAVGTQMSLLFPCEFWDTGFNVVFHLDSEEAFSSSEARTAEEIMRTFNSF